MERNILVYNNNTKIVERIAPLLANEGMKLVVASHFDELEKVFEYYNIHLIITDVLNCDKKVAPFIEANSPTEKKQINIMDGLELIAHIRKISSVPIIVVSREENEIFKILALNAGADDYVTVSCNPLVLMARIKSQLRRYTQLVNMRANIDRIYRVDGLEINDNYMKVSVEGRDVKLTPIEYKILRLLVQERGKVLSISQIYETIWQMQAIGADNTIAVHIRHIREKIENDPKQPRYLKVVWGTGYKVG